jgi:hypothetical protein
MLLNGLQALVAIETGAYLFPVILPENQALPALTYQIVGGVSYPTFNTSGMQKQRVQFDCYGKSYLSAATVRATLIAALNGYKGTLADGMVLQFANYIQSVDHFEDDARQFRCTCEFYLFFNFASSAPVAAGSLTIADTGTGTLYVITVANGALGWVQTSTGTGTSPVFIDTVTGSTVELTFLDGAPETIPSSSSGVASISLTDSVTGSVHILTVVDGALTLD